MMEIHAIPTAVPYNETATYYTYVNGEKQAGVPLNPVVFYDREGRLETGMLGIIKMIQISTSVLATKPKLNDIIEIDGQEYKFISPIKKANPGFVTFWESEVKSTKNN